MQSSCFRPARPSLPCPRRDAQIRLLSFVQLSSRANAFGDAVDGPLRPGSLGLVVVDERGSDGMTLLVRGCRTCVLRGFCLVRWLLRGPHARMRARERLP